MSGPNFELITELQTLTRRDFPVADPTILQPLGAAPLLDGEWLELDGNYKLARKPEITGHTAVGGTKEGANLLVFPVHTERGRYDTQAIGKVNVLYFGMYEAETKVADLTSLNVGDALTVADLGAGAGAYQDKRGLAKKAGSSVVVVGYVSRLPGGGKVRFVHYANILVA